MDDIPLFAFARYRRVLVFPLVSLSLCIIGCLRWDLRSSRGTHVLAEILR